MKRWGMRIALVCGLLSVSSPSTADAYFAFEDCKYHAYQQCYVGNGYKPIEIVDAGTWCADGRCPSNFNGTCAKAATASGATRRGSGCSSSSSRYSHWSSPSPASAGYGYWGGSGGPAIVSVDECNQADYNACLGNTPGNRGENTLGLPGVYMAPVPNGGGTAGLPVGTDLVPPFTVGRMSADGVTLEALQGPDSVCLRVDHAGHFGSMSCNHGMAVVPELSPIIATELTPDGVQVSGFTADGVDAVRLLTAAGDQHVVAVQGNLFTTELPTDPVEAAWTAAGGEQRSISLLR